MDEPRIEFNSLVYFACYDLNNDVILVNPSMRDYPEFFKFVMRHEEKHFTNHHSSKNFFTKIYHDLKYDYSDQIKIEPEIVKQLKEFRKSQRDDLRKILKNLIYTLFYYLGHFPLDCFLIIQEMRGKS